jgi:hypothetical protein
MDAQMDRKQPAELVSVHSSVLKSDGYVYWSMPDVVGMAVRTDCTILFTEGMLLLATWRLCSFTDTDESF